MIECVTGFLFSDDRMEVALIKKNRPDWQKGFLNGIGGKSEPNESPLGTMIREFYEETGVAIDGWEQFLTIKHLSHNTLIHFFRAFNSAALGRVKSKTDEIVHIVDVASLQSPICALPYTLPNLRWIIPLALDLEYQPLVTMVLK